MFVIIAATHWEFFKAFYYLRLTIQLASEKNLVSIAVLKHNSSVGFIGECREITSLPNLIKKLMSYPPQHKPMPAGSSGTTICGAYAGYVVYDNGGAGYTPDAGTVSGIVQVQVGGVYIPSANYNLLWRSGPTTRGCAAVVSGSTTKRSFASSPASQYTLTVYFLAGHVPVAGTDVILEITFV